MVDGYLSLGRKPESLVTKAEATLDVFMQMSYYYKNQILNFLSAWISNCLIPSIIE